MADYSEQGNESYKLGNFSPHEQTLLTTQDTLRSMPLVIAFAFCMHLGRQTSVFEKQILCDLFYDAVGISGCLKSTVDRKVKDELERI